MQKLKVTRLSEGYYYAKLGGHEIVIQSELHTEIDGRGWMFWLDGRDGGDVFPTLGAARIAAYAAYEDLLLNRRGQTLSEYLASEAQS